MTSVAFTCVVMTCLVEFIDAVGKEEYKSLEKSFLYNVHRLDVAILEDGNGDGRCWRPIFVGKK